MEFVIAECKLWPKQVKLFHFKISSATITLLPLSVVMKDSEQLVKSLLHCNPVA